jgi:hypothetical protein
MKLRWIPVLLVLIAPTGSWAHDFWIEPSSFEADPEQRIQVRLRVGEDFDGDAIPRDPDASVRFVAASENRVEEIPGVAGRDPAGFLVLRDPKPIVIAYESRGQIVEHTEASFRRFLDEEELVGTIEIPDHAAGRERFIRCAKSLISVGGPARSDHLIGMQVELLAERLPAGESKELVVRLYANGLPKSGAVVTAIARHDPANGVSARTDRSGRVRLYLGAPGPWLVKTVVLERGGDGVDYTSYWASLTFE